jgi:hypothetical protein
VYKVVVEATSANEESFEEFLLKVVERWADVRTALLAVPQFDMTTMYERIKGEHDRAKMAALGMLVEMVAADHVHANVPPKGENASDKCDVNERGYLVREVLEMIGCGNTTLNKYAKLAKVPTPGVGCRNHRYSRADIIRILETITGETPEVKLAENCGNALRKITAEITSKSLNHF